MCEEEAKKHCVRNVRHSRRELWDELYYCIVQSVLTMGLKTEMSSHASDVNLFNHQVLLTQQQSSIILLVLLHE